MTGFRYNEAPSGVQDRVNKVFTVAVAYQPGTLQVWRNGILTSFTELDAFSFEMAVAPLPQENLVVAYRESL